MINLINCKDLAGHHQTSRQLIGLYRSTHEYIAGIGRPYRDTIAGLSPLAWPGAYREIGAGLYIFFSSPGYLRYFVCCRIGGDICYFRYRQRESDILDIIFAMFRHVYLMFQLFWIFDNLDMLLQNIRMYLQYLIFWIFWILNVFLAYWKLVDISAILDNSLQISDISDTSDILDILCELVLNVASTRYIRYFRYF